jgi:hypothetical protein
MALIKPLTIMTVGSALGATAAYFVQKLICPMQHFFELSQNQAITALDQVMLAGSIAASCAIAFGIYLAVCVVLKLEEPHEALKRLRRARQQA